MVKIKLIKKITLLLIVLIMLPFTGLAQNDSIVKKEDSFKSQIDLDVYFLGLELAYKRKINANIVFGISIGSTMLKPTLNSDFDILGGYFEIVRLRPFLDFGLNDKIHLELGTVISGTMSIDDDNTGYSFGIEAGIFFSGEKLSFGIRPSLLYYNDNSPVLTASLIVIKMPLKKW